MEPAVATKTATASRLSCCACLRRDLKTPGASGIAGEFIFTGSLAPCSTYRRRDTMTDLAILACYAHPDDEQGVSGTLAWYADQGVRTGLICATRGELGEIADPRLATPDTLGQVRELEMYNAAAVIK